MDVVARAFPRSESIAETQPQLQLALLSLSAMISQYFTRHYFGISLFIITML